MLAALLILITGGGIGRGVPIPKPKSSNHLPDKIVTAWKDAGAEVGWLRLAPNGFQLDFVGEMEGKPGDLPAFRLKGWEEGRIPKRAAPSSAFGLDLTGTVVTLV